MPFISMRELLRDPKQVFSDIEDGGEPFVVTRRGHPVAALVPIDPSQVETSVLAAAPEFLRSRREAEDARAEGRTAPLEAVARRLDLWDAEEEPETTTAVAFEDLTLLMQDLFGVPLAEEFTTEAAARIDEISLPVVRVVAGAETPAAVPLQASSAADRVRAINAQLFQLLMHDVMADAKAGVVASLGAEAVTRDDPVRESDQGVFGRRVAEEALNRVSVRLRTFNEQVVETSRESGEFSLSTYEATLRGIGAVHGLTPGIAQTSIHQPHLGSLSARSPYS
jgi:antitoxin (DNA-binding transcriptional repressor) of toxin-antitoxin stability system